MASRLCRSYLFAPGDNEKLLGKVFDAGADAVVLDLEDAVAPARKEQARQMTAAALQHYDRQGNQQGNGQGAAVYVRLNAGSTGLWREDLRAVVHPALRGLRLAKAESAEELKQLNEALTEAESRAGLTVGSLTVTPTIESAAGLLAAAEMAKLPRVEAFAFGATDFLRDIGAELDAAETATLYARSQLVVVSRAAGLRPPIASVHTRLQDLEGLRATSEAARQLGFFGRSCIHPSQLAVIHEVFTPKPEQLAEARAMIEAFENAQAAGAGAFALADGQFVDRAVVERARALVALAEL